MRSSARVAVMFFDRSVVPQRDVSITVEKLPLEIACGLDQMQREEPEQLRSLVIQLFTQKIIYDTLASRFAR